MRLLDAGSPAVSVGVSAFNTDVAVEDGRLRLPKSHGGDFQVNGIPKGNGYLNPIGPEQAVIVAARAADARVAEVPELILPHRTFSFVFSRWKLVLDRPVSFRVRATGEERTSTTVFVGLEYRVEETGPVHDALLLPRRVQPSADTTLYVSASEEVQTLVVHIREDVPVLFDEVEVVR